MCVDICTDTCEGMCAGMCTDTCTDICIDMRTDMPIHLSIRVWTCVKTWGQTCVQTGALFWNSARRDSLHSLLWCMPVRMCTHACAFRRAASCRSCHRRYSSSTAQVLYIIIIIIDNNKLYIIMIMIDNNNINRRYSSSKAQVRFFLGFVEFISFSALAEARFASRIVSSFRSVPQQTGC